MDAMVCVMDAVMGMVSVAELPEPESFPLAAVVLLTKEGVTARLPDPMELEIP